MISESSGPPGATGPGGAGGAGGMDPGEIGGLCDVDEDCTDGATCTQVGSQKICTVPCPPACPQDTYCALIQGDSVCIPDVGQQCLTCIALTDCKHPSDKCLTAPLGDRFCARDCTTLGACPNGFTCVDGEEYAATGGAGGGGGDAPAPSGVPYKYCVPNGGLSCPCNAKREGVTHTCLNENASGTCSGYETCDGSTGKWEGCTATVPAAETCNAKDDDCDEQIDEGEPNDLCAAQGPPPLNTNWACDAGGACDIGACAEGWVAYPPGPAQAGCPCKLDAGEPNDLCAMATVVATVNDTPASVSLLNGTLSSDSDVDVWRLETVDTAQNNTNSYHVSIDFLAPSPNSEFVFDVIRGNACNNAPAGPTTGLTQYDWCVDGTSGTQGEGVCGPQAAVHCADHSSRYFVRVRRKPGATATCNQYSVQVKGNGGGACEFNKKCP